MATENGALAIDKISFSGEIARYTTGKRRIMFTDVLIMKLHLCVDFSDFADSWQRREDLNFVHCTE